MITAKQQVPFLLQLNKTRHHNSLLIRHLSAHYPAFYIIYQHAILQATAELNTQNNTTNNYLSY